MENPTNPLTDSMAQPESEELKPTTTDRLPEVQSLEVADPTPLENESKSAEESKTSVNARLADMTELELLDSLATLLQGEELPRRQEVEAYKSAFYKKKQARAGELAEQGNSLLGIGEFIIAKHRNGPVDDVRLRFRSEFAKFLPLEAESMVKRHSRIGGSPVEMGVGNGSFAPPLPPPEDNPLLSGPYSSGTSEADFLAEASGIDNPF